MTDQPAGDEPPLRRRQRRLADAPVEASVDATEPEVADPADGTDPATEPAPARRRGGWLRLVGTSLLAAVLAVIVGIGLLAIVVPAVTGSTALTVLTSSMEPHLPPGTMVVMRPTDPADIEPGMVVTYQLKSGEATVVTHRVTQVLRQTDGERVFITQGDANPSADIDPVREVQIRGTVWYAIPYVGWAALALQGEQRAIVITIAVVALFGYAAWAVISSVVDKARARRRIPADANSTAPADAP